MAPSWGTHLLLSPMPMELLGLLTPGASELEGTAPLEASSGGLVPTAIRHLGCAASQGLLQGGQVGARIM